MRHGKSLLATVIVLTGLTSSASAQGFAVAGATGNAFAGGVGLGGIGLNQGYTGFNTGFNNFGGYNNFGLYNNGFNGGLGYSNFNNGLVTRAIPYPQTQNNMFGLMNSIRTQTGGGNSYRYGYGPAVGGRRR